MLFIIQSPYWFTIGRRGVLRLGGWTPHVQSEFHELEPTLGLTSHNVTGLSPSVVRLSRRLTLIYWLIRFRSALLTESRLLSFPPGTEMFQFSGFAPSRVTLQCRVSPFGNLRIKGCLHLPTAYRSMPRPSSPLVAKASIRCSYQDTCLKRFRPPKGSKTRDVIHRSGPRLPLDQKPVLAVAQARFNLERQMYLDLNVVCSAKALRPHAN